MNVAAMTRRKCDEEAPNDTGMDPMDFCTEFVVKGGVCRDMPPEISLWPTSWELSSPSVASRLNSSGLYLRILRLNVSTELAGSVTEQSKMMTLTKANNV